MQKLRKPPQVRNLISFSSLLKSEKEMGMHVDARVHKVKTGHNVAFCFKDKERHELRKETLGWECVL
jgi:hypothetical protein